MKISPLTLRIALAFKTGADINTRILDEVKSPAGIDALKWLYDNDLIDRNDHMACGTDRLDAWIDHILSQPLPEKTWVVPKSQ